VESFGARLKREREQRKVSLDDIAVSTKIGTRFLLALEEEHFDQLPGGIFNKSFVRAYARHLGIDEAQAIADYVAASGTSLPETKPEEAPELAVLAVRAQETPSNADRIPWGVFAIVLLVVAFGFALWGFHSREKSPRPSRVVSSPVNAGAPVAAPQAAPAMPPRPAVPEAGSVPAQSSAPEPAPAAPEATAAAMPASDSAPPPGAFLVLIKAREDAWVAIAADGKQIVEDTLAAATEKSVQARNQIVIKTGNAGALDISFNGQKLPPQGAYNQVKTLTFDPNGLRP
jgi:cytoskeleton protein RodZ